MATQPNPRDPDVIVYQAFAGVRNDVQPERFGNSDLIKAVNCNLDKSGQLTRRDGFSAVVTGACHSLWADDSQTVCLFVQNGLLKKLNLDLTTTTLQTIADPAAAMSYTEVNGVVYFSNGTDTGVLAAATPRSWGITPPAPPSVTASISGSMPAGQYQFTMTFVRDDGQESGAPLAGVMVLPAGTGLVFALAVSADPTVVSKNLYLSTPNGEVAYLAAHVSNATSSVTYTGDTLELTLPLNTAFLQPPPAGQLTAYYRGRMFVAVGDTLYPSEPYAYELFNYQNYMQFDAPITLLAPMNDKERGDVAQGSGFFIGTERTCGIIVGSSPEDFQYVPKMAYGAIKGALDYVDGSVFGDNSLGAVMLPMWLTPQGICVGKPDMQIQNLTRTKYGFAAGGTGAAIFMPGPNRFIATSNF
jgi:hypothetical protein